MISNKKTFFYNLLIIQILGLILTGTSGCAGAIFGPLFLLKGTDVPALFKKEVKEIPKESKIVVICRSSLNLFGDENPSGDLSRCITYLMKDKLSKKKFEWIPYEEVEESFDDESLMLESFSKMGKKVKADYVIGVDMDDFNIHLSSQFYQGRSKLNVKLIQVETGEIIAQNSMPQFIYPPTPIINTDIHSSEFQKKFIGKLANEVGCLFYPHDPHGNIAMDTDFPVR